MRFKGEFPVEVDPEPAQGFSLLRWLDFVGFLSLVCFDLYSGIGIFPPACQMK
jgi:hypothetical protein